MSVSQAYIQQLIESGLLPDTKFCGCGSEMTLDLGERLPFKCQKCRKSCSALQGTIFEGYRLPLQTAHELLKCWWRGVNISHAADAFHVQQRTVWSWYMRCRLMCCDYFEKNRPTVGGPGVVVEVDECLLMGRRNIIAAV